MRKGRDGGKTGRKKNGEKNGKKTGKKKKIRMKIVATTSLPAVDRPNAGTPHARAKRSFYMSCRNALYLFEEIAPEVRRNCCEF